MENPTLYIYGGKDSMPDLERFDCCSNLDYAKEQCIRQAQSYSNTRIVYKLVPVFEASLEVTTKVIEHDLVPPEPKESKPL